MIGYLLVIYMLSGSDRIPAIAIVPKPYTTRQQCERAAAEIPDHAYVPISRGFCIPAP